MVEKGSGQGAVGPGRGPAHVLVLNEDREYLELLVQLLRDEGLEAQGFERLGALVRHLQARPSALPRPTVLLETVVEGRPVEEALRTLSSEAAEGFAHSLPVVSSLSGLSFPATPQVRVLRLPYTPDTLVAFLRQLAAGG